MNVPLLDLKLQYQTIKEEVLRVTEEIFASQQFILGPHVEQLEENIAAYCGAGFGVGVSSGTDALIIALMAAGVGAGDLVLTSPYSFFATAGAIVRLGAVPVFADIDPATYNIAPEAAAQVVKALPEAKRRRFKAVIPVHLYGQCADMDPLNQLAADLGLTVIEDAAQAIGAEYRGRRAGALGRMGCFSFFPSKNLGAFGDAGLVTTNDAGLAAKLKILRVHGSAPKYYHHLVGGNFRIDALQAAILNIKLARLDDWTAGRQANAARYRSLFEKAGLTGVVGLPATAGHRHIYNQFVIRVAAQMRDRLRDQLAKAGIGTEIYYPVPLHLQACFADLGYKAGDFPESEKAAAQTLALPIYPELTADQQDYVVDRIKAFFIANNL